MQADILTAQTGALIGPETGIKNIAAVHSQCRSWVKSGQTITGENPQLSALVQKRPFEARAGATPAELMAVGGWANLASIRPYLVQTLE